MANDDHIENKKAKLWKLLGRTGRRIALRNKNKWPNQRALGCRASVTTMTQLALILGCSRDALYGDTLSSDIEPHIRAIYEIDDPCWKVFLRDADPNIFGSKYEKLHDDDADTAPERGTVVRPTPSPPISRDDPNAFPSTHQQFLARLHALHHEEAAGAEIGNGEFIAAQHAVKFVGIRPEPLDPAGDEPPPPFQLKPEPAPMKPRPRPDQKFASIEFPRSFKNEHTPPPVLSLDVCLDEGEHGLYASLCDVRFRLTGKSAAGPVGERPGLPGELVVKQGQTPISKSRLAMTPHGGGQNPGYKIAVRKGPIGAFTAIDILTVHDAADGDTVTAYLVVGLKGLARVKDKD